MYIETCRTKIDQNNSDIGKIALTQMNTYKVPRVLWENLEAVLLAQSKRYIGELASRLHVPEKELIRRVLPTSDSLQIMIMDTHAESNQCKAYVQQDQLTVFCKKPVASHSEYCPHHITKRMTVVNSNATQIQRVKDNNTHGPVWVAGTNVINSSGDIVGKLNRSDHKLKLFVLD